MGVAKGQRGPDDLVLGSSPGAASGAQGMADEEQLAILKQGSEVWNAWRQKQYDSEIDLREAYLIGADLIRANLIGADLDGTNLGRTNLSDADLSGADLNGSMLYETILADVDLS